MRLLMDVESADCGTGCHGSKQHAFQIQRTDLAGVSRHARHRHDGGPLVNAGLLGVHGRSFHRCRGRLGPAVKGEPDAST